MAEATSSPAGVGASNTSRRFKEELEAAKTRLSDQHFSMARYADPFVMRPVADRQFWPRDVTPQMEEKWLAMIEAIKAERKAT